MAAGVSVACLNHRRVVTGRQRSGASIRGKGLVEWECLAPVGVRAHHKVPCPTFFVSKT